MDKITQNTKWAQAKSNKTQSETKLELGPLLFLLKKGKEALKVETLVVLNLNF